MKIKRERLWRIRKPADWEKQVSRLPIHLQEKLYAVIDELSTLEDPAIFAVYERNLKYGSAFILRLNKSFRLSFELDKKDRLIILHRVGDHKTVGSKE